MYKNYYSMDSNPFAGHPNPHVFFKSENHQGAVNFLQSGIHEEEPFLLVLGQYGMGKTLLGIRLTEQLENQGVPCLNLSTPVISYANLLAQMLKACGNTPVQQKEESLHQQFLHQVDEKAMSDRAFVLILDEIQEYDASTLLKLRMLATYHCNGYYPFQFIFFGHPSFIQMLAQPQLGALAQRIRRRYTLQPFSLEESREYIYFRLIQSGASGRPFFPDEAVEAIHNSSGGIPRVINNICDACLLIGASEHLDVIDVDVVNEVLASAEPEENGDSFSQSAADAPPTPQEARLARSSREESDAGNRPLQRGESTSKVSTAAESLPFEDQSSSESNSLWSFSFKNRVLFGIILILLSTVVILTGLLLTRDSGENLSSSDPVESHKHMEQLSKHHRLRNNFFRSGVRTQLFGAEFPAEQGTQEPT